MLIISILNPSSTVAVSGKKFDETLCRNYEFMTETKFSLQFSSNDFAIICFTRFLIQDTSKCMIFSLFFLVSFKAEI